MVLALWMHTGVARRFTFSLRLLETDAKLEAAAAADCMPICRTCSCSSESSIVLYTQ